MSRSRYRDRGWVVLLGSRDGGYDVFWFPDDAWTSCEDKLPEIGKWVLIRWRSRGDDRPKLKSHKKCIAKLCENKAGLFWISYGLLSCPIKLEKPVWWADLPDWWDGWEDG